MDTTSQERGLGGYVSDGEIRTRYHFVLFEEDHKLFYHVKSNVYEGRLLLMGCVPTEEMREDAVRLAWQVPGVKSVSSEITVGDTSSFIQSTHDKWIATKLNTLLFFKENVSSRNYEVLVVGGTVYLVGVAKSQEELDTAIQVARDVSGVKKVVSYVRIMTHFEEHRRQRFKAKGVSHLEKKRQARQEPIHSSKLKQKQRVTGKD